VRRRLRPIKAFPAVKRLASGFYFRGIRRRGRWEMGRERESEWKRKRQACERTFEERHQPPPASDGSFSVELTQRQLHVEQRDAPDKQHYQVRHQERTCWAEKYICCWTTPSTFAPPAERSTTGGENMFHFKLFEIGFYKVIKCFWISSLSEFRFRMKNVEHSMKDRF